MERPDRMKQPKKIYRIDWDHSDHVEKLGYESQAEKIADHGVDRTDVEEALFNNEYPTAVTGQENARDYEGPVYEIVGRNNGGQYLVTFVIYVGDHTGIVLTAYFLDVGNTSEKRKMQRYESMTGGEYS